MESMFNNGGLLGKSNIPTTQITSGIWGLRQVFNAITDEVWPRDLPIVTDGLRLHLNAYNTNSYPGSGTEWYDLSGNNFHMKLKNGVVYNSSEKLFELDGSDDYGVCDGSISGAQPATVSNLGIGGSTEKTVVALVEVREIGSLDQGLFDMGDTGSAGQHYCLRLNGSYTNWRAQFWSTPDYEFSYNGRNNLVMYSVTYRSDQIGRTFVNNANLVGQDSGSYSLNTAGSRPFEMGRCNGGANAGIRAAAYLVYNRGLSDSEIQQNYNAFKLAYNIPTTPSAFLSINSSDFVSTISGSGTQSDPFTTQSDTQNQDDTTAFAEFIVSGSGTLYYDVRVSSESNYDFARLIVDGNTLVDISGTTSDNGNTSVSDGNIIRFEYEKDGSVSNNDDTGYLDALYIL